ncbi:hypothetical protein M9458_049958, partial [Cirrhinus mrigala]
EGWGLMKESIKYSSSSSSFSSTGQISLSEFMEGAQRDAWIMDLLKLDTNARG